MGSLTVRVQLVPRLPGELCTERSALFNVPVVSSGASLEVAGESLDALRRHCNSGKNEIAQAVQDLAGEFRISPQEIFNKEGDVVNALAKHVSMLFMLQCRIGLTDWLQRPCSCPGAMHTCMLHQTATF